MWSLIWRFAPHILVVAVAVGAVWYAYSEGHNAGEAAQRVACNEQLQRTHAEYEQAARAAADEQDRLRAQAVDQARAYWQANQQREVVTEYIDREVVEYVERETSSANTCQLDADFLRIWNAANSGNTGTGAGAD